MVIASLILWALAVLMVPIPIIAFREALRSSKTELGSAAAMLGLKSALGVAALCALASLAWRAA